MANQLNISQSQGPSLSVNRKLIPTANSILAFDSSKTLVVSPLGYATGGGAVTQLTNRATGVTINTICGQITTSSASLAVFAEAQFTVTNSMVTSPTDIVLVTMQVQSSTGQSFAYCAATAVGAFAINLTNLHPTVADTSASILNFMILKSVAA